jgi:hypothetical protein
MKRLAAKPTGRPGVENEMLALESDTAAYSGRLQDAREMGSAERAQEKDAAATYAAVSALREGLFGNTDEARRGATSAVGRLPGREVLYGAALALAYTADDRRAQALNRRSGQKVSGRHHRAVQFPANPPCKACGQSGRGFRGH